MGPVRRVAAQGHHAGIQDRLETEFAGRRRAEKAPVAAMRPRLHIHQAERQVLDLQARYGKGETGVQFGDRGQRPDRKSVV